MVAIRAFSHSDFLCAAHNLAMPVLRLPQAALPVGLRHRGIVFHAMLGFYTPSHNIKYIPASYMLERALAGRDATHALTLIESSSGNFVLSLAACAKVHGLKVTAIVSDHLPDGKLQPLLASGIDVLTESAAKKLTGRDAPATELASLMGQRPGWINLGQYSNATNPESYAALVAPALLGALGGDIQLFAAGLGSAGTLVGLGGALKQAIPGLKTLAVIPRLGDEIPGCRDDRRLKEISHDWRSCADHHLYVGTASAYKAALSLWDFGIPVGPSSGAAFVGVCELLAQTDRQGLLPSLRNVQGIVNCAFPCPDTMYPYWQEARRYRTDLPAAKQAS